MEYKTFKELQQGDLVALDYGRSALVLGPPSGGLFFGFLSIHVEIVGRNYRTWVDGPPDAVVKLSPKGTEVWVVRLRDRKKSYIRIVAATSEKDAIDHALESLANVGVLTPVLVGVGLAHDVAAKRLAAE